MIIQQPLLAGGLTNHPGFQGIPAVYVCHSFAYEEYYTRERRGRVLRSLASAWLKHEEKKLLDRSDTIIVLSEYTRRKLEEIYSIVSGVTVIPGGVDNSFHQVSVTDRQLLRDRFGMKGFSFLTVRNLVPRTGVDLLVDAFNMVHERHTDVELWIAGVGPLEPTIREKIRNYGLDDSVRMLGFVSDETLPDLYRAADCFVLPSLFLEGFGLVTIESLACGTPVVATPVGANMEVAGGWRDDAVVESVDLHSLSSGMDHMLTLIRSDVESLRQSCAQYGSRFTWSNHVDHLEKELLTLKEKYTGF